MPSKLLHIDQNNSFEQTVYRTSLLVGAVITFILGLLDIISLGLDLSFVLELTGLVLLLLFYIFSFYNSSRWQHTLFIIVFFGLIDFAWIFDGGSNIIHILIYILISIYALLLILPIFRKALVFFIIANLLTLVMIETFGNISITYLDNSNEFKLIFRLIVLISFSSLLLAMIYFRKQYDRERRLLFNRNSEISKINTEVNTTNTDLENTNKELASISTSIEEIVSGLERKNKQVKKLKESLEKRVLSRTEQLIRKNDELDLLFYRSSHDFRRPLTSLLGLSEFANIACTSEAKEILMLVAQTAEEMDGMFKKFYSLYQINHYKEEFKDYSLIEIYKILQDRVEKEKGQLILENRIMNTEVINKRNLPLFFILDNLIENALFYKIPKQPCKIELTGYEEGDDLKFVIKDFGQGIPQEYQEKVFEMYFKANLGSKGNGLGLYVASKAVEKLGGKIILNSQENEYSEFIITYPKVEEDIDEPVTFT